MGIDTLTDYIHKNGMFPFIYNNTGITDDKVLHFIISFIIGYILYKINISFKTSFFIIIILSFIKEFIDFYTGTGNLETLDIISNLIGFLLVSFFYFKKNGKNKQYV